MRILLLALMIALLPLRGWVGDVMAMERVGQALVTTQAPAAVHGDRHETRPHHGQVPAAHANLTAAGGHDSVHAGADCAGGTGCQICHSVALAGPLSVTSAALLPTAVPHAPVQRHASAERAPGYKPPIS